MDSCQKRYADYMAEDDIPQPQLTHSYDLPYEDNPYGYYSPEIRRLEKAPCGPPQRISQPTRAGEYSDLAEYPLYPETKDLLYKENFLGVATGMVAMLWSTLGFYILMFMLFIVVLLVCKKYVYGDNNNDKNKL
jgi:hypothetical protein